MGTRLKKRKQISGMVDTSEKDTTKRLAVASGVITLSKDAYKELMQNGSPKGDVWETAKVAGILAAKNVPNVIPMCHPLELNKVKVQFENNVKNSSVKVIVETAYVGKTGVEMEALAAVSGALLTIYDMMKWKDKGMVISDIKLLHKSGGKSGIYNRK
jgi:cyclic pyranopterin monophosphate synthase